jgi:hypothetical protein
MLGRHRVCPTGIGRSARRASRNGGRDRAVPLAVKGWACSSPSQTSDWDRPDDGPAQITGLRQTTRFRCEKPGARSGRVRRAHHCSQSVQMATLSRRPYHVVCALVSALPHLCGTDGGDDQGKRFGHQSQLCVAVGADLRPGAGQTLPAASETNQSELESRNGRWKTVGGTRLLASLESARDRTWRFHERLYLSDAARTGLQPG